MASMINKQNVRRFILDYAKRKRSHTFTRVSPAIYEQVEAVLREHCRRIVHAQPSAGKTIK